jgi:hypothetical protein
VHIPTNNLDPRVLPSIDLTGIAQWFARAVPDPTDKNRSVQVGVHFEEVHEMAEAIGAMPFATLHELATFYKSNVAAFPLSLDRKELLDALCDQIVTAVGVAHMFGLDIGRAINAVNASNWSKFDEHGNPIFNEQGKIVKGPNYFKPDLDNCL